jgi:cell division protease FtsH
MSEALGLATYEQPRRPLFLDTGVQIGKEYGEDTARAVDHEVRDLLATAHDRVRATLEQHEPALRALARRLIETEVVDRATLASVLAAAQTGDGVAGDSRAAASARLPDIPAPHVRTA